MRTELPDVNAQVWASVVVSWEISEFFFEGELLETLPCGRWGENGVQESLFSLLLHPSLILRFLQFPLHPHFLLYLFNLFSFLSFFPPSLRFPVFSLSTSLYVSVCLSSCFSTSLSVCLLPTALNSGSHPWALVSPVCLSWPEKPVHTPDWLTWPRAQLRAGYLWSEPGVPGWYLEQRREEVAGALQGAAVPLSSVRGSTPLLSHVIPNVLEDFRGLHDHLMRIVQIWLWPWFSVWGWILRADGKKDLGGLIPLLPKIWSSFSASPLGSSFSTSAACPLIHHRPALYLKLFPLGGWEHLLESFRRKVSRMISLLKRSSLLKFQP